MTALPFAWRSLVRQPARAILGILGVAAVGALLFDMLLLSQGLLISMRDLLNRSGYDVRVTATTDLPRSGPRIANATAVTQAVATVPTVRSALAIRFDEARFQRRGQGPLVATFEGPVGTAAHPWNVTRGRDVMRDGEVVIAAQLARELGVDVGATLPIRVSCRDDELEALPPFNASVAGIADFPFELGDEQTLGGSLATLDTACSGNVHDAADMILVVSSGDPDATAAAVRSAHPELRVATNEQMVGRVQQGGFTYFQQISTVLTTVTLAFSVLLITVLLTVSVNQRLGEIAALRALGLSRARMVADVLSESGLIVGIGGLLSLPLGFALATWLDLILKRMPGIPTQLHFFVYRPNALGLHVALMVATAIIAALYPMRIVATLPIAATLRAEVID
jgi:putative ABC transport system permease protein